MQHKSALIPRQYGIWTYWDPPFWLAIRRSVRKFGEIWPALFQLFGLVVTKGGWWFLLLVSGHVVQELVQGIQLQLDAILVKEACYTQPLYGLTSTSALQMARID